ncbi:PEP-CTERM sorting domain-containing protein [Anaerohalosphaera lusitana]|nr:PEP-CTERM sorting domain-containing protein [Anaerohalosphaera lusitana]
MDWTVTRDSSDSGIAGWWKYEYTFNITVQNEGQSAISHLTLERSVESSGIDFADFQYWVDGEAVGNITTEFVDYNATSNTDGVGPAAIKFETDDSDISDLGHEFRLSFYSRRNPVWGDFYAKNGKYSGQGQDALFNSAWNISMTDEGLIDYDPITPPSSGSLNSHILVPDTTVIPEPTSLMLAAFGMGLMRLRRRS